MAAYRIETSSGFSLVINGGRIAAEGTRADRVLVVGAGQLYPGLINAHDHLHRNHYPRLGRPPYEDAYMWGMDIHASYGAEIARARSLGRADALYFGALKNIIGGVTTVVHHDAWEPAFDAEFPLRVAPVRTLHSLGFDRMDAISPPSALPLCIHLAEGTNLRATSEVSELARLGLLNDSLLAVHVVGVDAHGAARLHAAGAAVVWCPTSNQFLFGRTASRALFNTGIDMLLGTDALLTGAGTLLEELRAAARLGCVTEERLLAGTGSVAARRLGLPTPSLLPGARADVILLRQPPLQARPSDVALVVVGGRPVMADAELGEVFELVGGAPAGIVVGGVEKLAPPALVRAAARAVDLFPECGRILA